MPNCFSGVSYHSAEHRSRFASNVCWNFQGHSCADASCPRRRVCAGCEKAHVAYDDCVAAWNQSSEPPGSLNAAPSQSHLLTLHSVTPRLPLPRK